ncbi:MAG: hypothetical protein ABJ004_19800 [Cyclobacteriaceae bacterium]
MVIAWVAILQQPTTNPGSIILGTTAGAQLGYWFFTIGFQLNLNYHERKNNNLMVMFSWAAIFIGTFAFGGIGLKGLISAIIQFSDPEAIRTTITIFWGYGIAQVGIRTISGDSSTFELPNRKTRRK